MPTPSDIVERAVALQGPASGSVKGEYVVSQALLKQFQERGTGDAADKGMSLYLEAPGIPYRDVRNYGKVPKFNFVPFAGRSVEERWRTAEGSLPETLEAVADGTALSDAAHVQRLRELIVLHFIRSIGADIDHWYRWEPLHKTAQAACAAEPADRRASLVGFAAQTLRLMGTGPYFDALIEANFDRMLSFAESSAIEILIPEQGEFLIGDIPALPMMPGYVSSARPDEAGILSAHCIVLPLGPTHMAKLGGASRITTVPAGTVNALNEAQVWAAFSSVFFRPDSDLRTFVQEIKRPRPSTGRLRDVYNKLVRLHQQARPKTSHECVWQLPYDPSQLTFSRT